MGFDIKLLGTFEASVGGVSFVSSASKQRQVLAVLTVNSGRTIPMSRLTEELWGTTPPRSSSTTIHTYIGKVRRALDLALHDDPRLEGKDVHVPGDVSVVGFDGIALGGLSRIGLTTVAQPHERLAEAGIRLLLERIGGDADAPPRQILLEPQLIVRSTTARKEP